jgi:multidrug transporter EmrE-like cation transporter
MSALGAAGDAFLKAAGQGRSVAWHLFAAGTVAYLLTVPGWFFVIRHVPLHAVGALYAASTVVLLAVTGALWFHERLQPADMVGIALALLAVGLLRRVL